MAAALEDLKSYLTTTLASKYDDTVLNHVLEVEVADQTSRVRTAYKITELVDDWKGNWSDVPAPLREAIMRRCCRNLALRKLPLGITEGEAGSLRIGGRDGEIKRLEAPYVRLVVG